MNRIDPHLLISQPAVDFTSYIYNKDYSLDIYLHREGGQTSVGGGNWAPQTINSVAIPASDQAFIEDTILELNKELAANFLLSNNSNDSDISIYYDSNIESDSPDSVILGVAIPNASSEDAWWELFLNEPAFSDDSNHLRYALLHELGHALGLEHPFDDSDGDIYQDITDPSSSALPEETLMSYRYPSLGEWPTEYSSNDWNALKEIWGEATPILFSQPKLDYQEMSQFEIGRDGGSAYVVVEGKTWKEAEANANSIGGNLVSIDSQEEDEWLNTFIGELEKDENITPFQFSYTKYTLDVPEDENHRLGDPVPEAWISSQNIDLQLSNAYWIGKNIPSGEPIYINDDSGEDKVILGEYPYRTPWSNGSKSSYEGESALFNSLETGKWWEPIERPALHLPDPDYFYLKIGSGGEEEGAWANTPTSPWETYSGIVRPYANAASYGIAEIHLFDLELGYHLKSDQGSDLTQSAVLGDSIDSSERFTLEITGESLRDGYRIESTDITVNFDPLLFNTIQASDIRIGKELPIANAVYIDNEAGAIRIAASSLSNLAAGEGIEGQTVLASISLDFDETALATIDKHEDGSLKRNALSFTLSANADETIFSKEIVDTSGLINREIVSLKDLGGYVAVDGQDVTLYEAKINFEQLGDGLVLGTQRFIGADASFTNLIRSGDTLSTSVDWLNVGNIDAHNLSYSEVYNQNASLAFAEFSQTSLTSGSFINGVFVENAREYTTLSTDIKITGEAGNVLDLSDGIVYIQANGSETFSSAGQGSSNLITYQGDLNYDGRVSMKDLAYLNAGAARQQNAIAGDTATDADGNGIIDASVAKDVDADFSGSIDLADLAVLDADWGKTLHIGDEAFQGSADISWSELDSQGSTSTWDNTSFKDQNATEAAPDYIGSLESPTATGVIGADGNNTSNTDSDITATTFQDPIPA